MDKSTKLYTKAINYYNDGYINKALEYCEKSISENLKNSSAINLKGLLYYLKGDLESAQALWKMNYQVNNDLVSKKYFGDSKNDEENKELYKTALKALKAVNIKEALRLLEGCRKSDFNSINISNSLVLCYIKMGDYNNAQKYIDKVLSIDKNNKIALEYRKELEDFGVIKKKFKLKYAAVVLTLAAVAVISIAIIKAAKEQINEKTTLTVAESKPVINTKDSLVKAEDGLEEGQKQDEKEESNQEPVELFPKDEISQALESKDYEKLTDIIEKWASKDLTLQEKVLVSKAKEVIESSGVSYFYNKGREHLSAKDYDKASENLTKSYNYGKESYLYSHIVYMMGLTYKSKGDIENAVKYYTEYDNKYSSGDYEETVLYELALIYKNIDNKACTSYAERLVKAYPKSIYNNSVINGILER